MCEIVDKYVKPDEPFSEAIDRVYDQWLKADKKTKKELSKAYHVLTEIDNRNCKFKRWNDHLK